VAAAEQGRLSFRHIEGRRRKTADVFREHSVRDCCWEGTIEIGLRSSPPQNPARDYKGVFAGNELGSANQFTAIVPDADLVGVDRIRTVGDSALRVARARGRGRHKELLP